MVRGFKRKTLSATFALMLAVGALAALPVSSASAFPKAELQMMKTTGKGSPEPYFTMIMEGAYITKVSNSGT
jgi:type VI protein secretion system component Hcp